MEIMWVAYDLLDTQRSDKVYKQWEYMADKKKKKERVKRLTFYSLYGRES